MQGNRSLGWAAIGFSSLLALHFSMNIVSGTHNRLGIATSIKGSLSESVTFLLIAILGVVWGIVQVRGDET